MWKSSVLGVLVLSMMQERLPFEGSVPLKAVTAQVDVSAILRTWRIKGVLACVSGGRPRKCLWVENAYPCGIFEVVHQPFRSHLPEVAPLMAALRKLPLALSSSAGSDKGQTNLQFADVRVYTYVPPRIEETDLPIAQPRGVPFTVNYVSELDAVAWRTGLVDRLTRPGPLTCDVAPDRRHCAGRWGPYNPREGFLVHQSEPKAAHLQAVRGGRVAHDPPGRFVMVPYEFEPRTGHLIQLIRPAWRRAIRIGEAGPIDEGAGSIHGAYLFVHLGIFEECRRCLPPRLVGPR